jgi:hypothetical protein
MPQAQKDNLKEWADIKYCPYCKRKNAMQFYITRIKCRWCGFDVGENSTPKQLLLYALFGPKSVPRKG